MADHSASGLFKSDALLKELPFDRYSKVASDASIEKAKKALEEKTHKVTVVNTKEEALEAIKQAIPKGASVSTAGSMTLPQIGLTDLLKSETHGWDNLHGKILAETDGAKQAELRRQAFGADYFLTSVTAVSETGDFTACDLTGTRVAGFLAAKNVIVVVGAQKIVPTYEDAVKRTEEYCLPLESGRARLVYGVPASSINNFLAIKGPNPWGAPGRFHLIIIKDSLGY